MGECCIRMMRETNELYADMVLQSMSPATLGIIRPQLYERTALISAGGEGRPRAAACSQDAGSDLRIAAIAGSGVLKRPCQPSTLPMRIAFDAGGYAGGVAGV